MTTAPIVLSLPPDAQPVEWRRFRRLCTILADADPASGQAGERATCFAEAGIKHLYPYPYLAAAANTLFDLWEQGWQVEISKKKPELRPPQSETDHDLEKQRIRRQELLRRDQQLSRPSVRRFIQSMESLRQHGDRLVSVFNLMRDGRDLAQKLADHPGSNVIQPYVQIVDESTDEYTGLRLHDIWRYFRHTWSNPYGTVPGRSMEVLVRDAAADCHPVIGLAAVSSAVVQIAERDTWIGWNTDEFLQRIQDAPSERIARWFLHRIDVQLSEIYIDDLVIDGILEPNDLQTCPSAAIDRLRADAERARINHHQQSTLKEIRVLERASWKERAESPLFRGKRSALLAELFEIAADVRHHLLPKASSENLAMALADPMTRKHLGRIVRHARGERVGTVVADLTVCGALAPYNSLAAGKLVAALAVSPTVVNAYRERYDRPSEIASSMAGRDIVREGRLAYIGTTSLYSTGSSQYNRLFWPADIIGGDPHDTIRYHELGRSKSFGTSHFSTETVDAFVRLAEQVGSPVRVNSVFGEGVSPRLRKVRMGLAALGWSPNVLLRHGRQRIVYGVPLVHNLLEYSLGVDDNPEYLVDLGLIDSDQRVASWWWCRWGQMRASRSEVLHAMRTNTLDRPVTHGARVVFPSAGPDEDW